MLNIQIAKQADVAELTALFQKTYLGNKDFSLREEAYCAKHFGTRSAVLTIRERARLLATMRGDLLTSTTDLAGEDESHLNDLMLPAFSLCRAAVETGYEQRGLNSLLRLCWLEAALALNMKTMVGFVYESAPRTLTMKQLGYEFSAIESKEGRAHLYKSRCLFAVLDLRQYGESAVSALRERSGSMKHCVGFTIDALRLNLGL